jgi:hypothetical protein
MYYKIDTNGMRVQMTDEEVKEYLASLPPPSYFENLKKQEIRNERNGLLASTDWTQAKDIPDAVSVKWAPYRQALRDVPAQSGFPDSVDWPTPPN